MTTTQSDEICLMVALSDQEASDLAQFLKRVGYAEFRRNAVDDDEVSIECRWRRKRLERLCPELGLVRAKNCKSSAKIYV